MTYPSRAVQGSSPNPSTTIRLSPSPCMHLLGSVRLDVEQNVALCYRTKGLCWLFLESYVRLSNCREAISDDCVFNRFSYQVMARLRLPQTVNISSALMTAMEAPIGTPNSATRFKDGISRNAAGIPKTNWGRTQGSPLFFVPWKWSLPRYSVSCNVEHGFPAE